MNLISKLGLGTVQFGINYGVSNAYGQTTKTEVASILSFARECAIDLLDTASAYGTSEKVLGENNIEDFKIVSKFISPKSNETILSQLQQSLKLLNINCLYGYLAHRPFDVVNNPRQWSELNNYKGKGYIKKIGFSFNEIDELESVLAKGFMPDIIQVPYNYLDNRFQPYMIDLKGKGCEIHTRSAFLQGLFFSEPNKLNTFFNGVKPTIQQLQEFGNALPGMLLKYCTDKPFIDKVIFGVNTLAQLKNNINNLSVTNSLPLKTKTIDDSILIPSKWPK